MIVTPLVGALVLFWMIDAQGVIGATLQRVFNNPDLSLKASATLSWVTLFVYGVWHSAPFSFVVFYAGLQTLPKDTLESAMIDGANRWERIRFVVVPHLAPLATFVALMQLMDNFRVFEPIVGFSALANATSLSYLIYNDLRSGDAPLFGSAAATSMLTIIGVVVLLAPVLLRTWRDFNRKAAR
jgi:ABC-type sugar transport system permease subunit